MTLVSVKSILIEYENGTKISLKGNKAQEIVAKLLSGDPSAVPWEIKEKPSFLLKLFKNMFGRGTGLY